MSLVWSDWSARGPFPGLQGSEVHLWLVRLSLDEASIERIKGLLSPADHQRLARFRLERSRQQFAVGRGVLRLLLGQYAGQKPASLEFDYGDLGKPSLRGHDIHFNYSDSSGLALYGFSRATEIGVDLEYLGREGRFAQIASRKFQPSETKAINAGGSFDKTRFLACWTRKEAYGKALGIGIRYPFNSVDLCTDLDADCVSLDDHRDGRAWSVYQLRPDPEFVGALVALDGDRSLRCFSLTAQELLKLA